MATHEQREKTVEETSAALLRVQNFDVDSLSRAEELGRELNFTAVLPHARRVIELFRQVAIEILGDFSQQRLNAVRDIALSEYNRLDQILLFSTTSQSEADARRHDPAS